MELFFQRLKTPRGNGLLSRIRRVLNEHTRALENIKGEDGITVRKNADGGLTIGGDGSTGAAASAYASYFRVVDASAGGECLLGVTDGAATVGELCGTVKINGVRADVDGATLGDLAVGTHYVWLYSWLSATAPTANAKIVFGTDEVPANDEGGILYAFQLVGRATVAEVTPDEGDPYNAITSITQDYLRGGEHAEFLFASYDGTVVPCPECT